MLKIKVSRHFKDQRSRVPGDRDTTAFNPPWNWKSDSRVAPAMWCLFQHWCTSAGEFTHFILVITFWIVFLEHHSLWLHLFGITCSWSQLFLSTCMKHSFPDPLVFAVGSMSSLLMDTLSHLIMEKNKRAFCSLHTSTCFESVEQLPRDTTGISCGQNDWTAVAWQLKGIASSVKESVPDSMLPGTPCVVWSIIWTFHGAKDMGKAASVTEFSGSCCWQRYFYLIFNYLALQIGDKPVATCYSEWQFFLLALLHARCRAFLISDHFGPLFFWWMWRIKLRTPYISSLYCIIFFTWSEEQCNTTALLRNRQKYKKSESCILGELLLKSASKTFVFDLIYCTLNWSR